MASTLSDQTPKPGDMIEMSRPGFKHWVVYVGDGDVVHVTVPQLSGAPGASTNSMVSVPTDKALVKKESLSDAVGDKPWKVHNSLDEKYKPRPDGNIVEEANAQVGKVLPYSVTRQNCEHFATDLRYGQPESLQVRKAVETVETAAWGLGIAAVVGTVLTAVAGGSNKANKRTQ